jgi:cobalt-zinc-cadmium efflux system outer membrane protein
MMKWGRDIVAVTAFVTVATGLPIVAKAQAQSGLNANQLVEIAIESNPQVKAARARWDAAEHQILQNYAPADPQFTYSNVDARKLFGDAAIHSHIFTENFQFPGKALLQADQAKRTALIARLAYEAAIRDLRAAVETGYYQVLLDESLAGVNRNNIAALKQVLQVTQVAYSANQVTQADFISAEFDLAQAEQQQHQYETARANDLVMLNQLLHRPPNAPLELDHSMLLEAVKLPVDTLVDMATRIRQEILQTALTERNANTALELAKMEYLPDFTVGYNFDYYLISSFAPAGREIVTPPPQSALLTNTQNHSLSIGFNLPVFFWIKQREDVKSAESSLKAARDDLSSIRSQTEAGVVQIFHTAQLAYETSQLYRKSLIPLAQQDFRVSLTAYQSNKLNFVALSGALQRSYAANVDYLQAANQFLAGRVALEQAVGAPLPQ